MDPILQKQLRTFFSKYGLIKYKRGEKVLRPGQTLTDVFFIKTGLCRVYVTLENEEDVTLGSFLPLYAISLSCTLFNKTCEYYVETLTEVECWQAPGKHLLEFISEKKETLVYHVQYVLNLFESSLCQKINTTIGNALEKTASSLALIAKEYGQVKKNRGVINFSVTHKMLASLTGLSRETTTLQMGKLEKLKIIKSGSKIVEILDWERLGEFAHLCES